MTEVNDVMVRNLPLDLLGPELEELFGEIGPIKKVAVIHHKKKPGDGGQVSRGFGFVKYALKQDALESIKQFNGKNIRGRSISVELATKKGGKPLVVTDIKQTSLKKDFKQIDSPKLSEKNLRNTEEISSVESNVDEKPSIEPETTEGGLKKKKATIKASKQEIEENPQPVNLRCVRIFGLNSETTKKQLMKRIQKIGQIENIELIQPEDATIPVWPQGVMAQVTMSTSKDATKLINSFDQKSLHGQTLTVRYEVHVSKGERTVKLIGSSIAKTLRVIVRNLSFKATEKDLSEAFSCFGPLSDVHIPYIEMPNPYDQSTMKKQSRGFGFVQFLLSNDLHKLLGNIEEKSDEHVEEEKEEKKEIVIKERGDENEQKTKKEKLPKKIKEKKLKPVVMVCDREVSYDLAQAKKKFDEIKQIELKKKEDEVGDDDDDIATTLKEVDENALANTKGQDDNTTDDDSVSDDDNDDVENSEDDGDDDNDDVENSEDDDDSESESDDIEQDKEEQDESNSKKKKKRTSDGKEKEDNEEISKNKPSKDVLQGRTIFVKNVPFEATNSDITHRLAEFGTVERTTIVKDTGTGLSRGTAFVTFSQPEEANEAVKISNKDSSSSSSSSPSGVMILGRKIEAMIAVDRNQAKEFGKEGREGLKEKKDKRNLYLKDEGMVFGVGDALRQEEGRQRHKKRRHDNDDQKQPSCPPSDMKKRSFAHAEKKKKLTNPLFFISPYRLSVKNLNKQIDDYKLKQIFMKAAQDGLEKKLVGFSDLKAQIDAHAQEEMNSKGQSNHNKKNNVQVPKLPLPTAPVRINACKIMRDLNKPNQPSRGYGFVEFATHAHALAALRWTNNNPLFSSTCVLGGLNSGNQADWPRLIVEFSIENKSKLQIIEKRKEISNKKSLQIQKILNNINEKEGNIDNNNDNNDNNDNNNHNNEKVKKLSRGQRQREKKRQLLLNNPKEEELDKNDKISFQTSESNRTKQENQKNKKQKLMRNKEKEEKEKEPEESLLMNGYIEENEENKKKNKKNKRKHGNVEVQDEFATMVNDYKTKLGGNDHLNKKKNIKKSNDSKLEDTMPQDVKQLIAAKFKSSSSRWFE